MQNMNFFVFRENFSVLLGIEVRAMSLNNINKIIKTIQFTLNRCNIIHITNNVIYNVAFLLSFFK